MRKEKRKKKGKEEEENTEMKKLTSKHQNDSILHKCNSTEKVSSWYP